MTGQRVPQLAGLGLQQDRRDRAEPGLLDLLRELVEPAEQLGHALDDEPERAHRAPQLAHRRRRLNAVADDVADRDEDTPVLALDQVVPVAADLELGGAGEVAHRRGHAPGSSPPAGRAGSAAAPSTAPARPRTAASSRPPSPPCARPPSRSRAPRRRRLRSGRGADDEDAERAAAERERGGDQAARLELAAERVALVAEPELAPGLRRHRLEQPAPAARRTPSEPKAEAVAPRADQPPERLVLDAPSGDRRDLDDAVRLHQLDERDVAELGDAGVRELAGAPLDVEPLLERAAARCEEARTAEPPLGLLAVAPLVLLLPEQPRLPRDLTGLLEQLDEHGDLRAQDHRVERLDDVVDGSRLVPAEDVLGLVDMPVRKMIGIDRFCSWQRIEAAVSKPSIPGIWTSSRMTANCSDSSSRKRLPARSGGDDPRAEGLQEQPRASAGCRRRRRRSGRSQRRRSSSARLSPVCIARHDRRMIRLRRTRPAIHRRVRMFHELNTGKCRATWVGHEGRDRRPARDRGRRAGGAARVAGRHSGHAAARRPPRPRRRPTCESRLLRDWSDGRIDGVYPVACYRAALRSLPADLEVYSSAPTTSRRRSHSGSFRATTLRRSRGTRAQPPRGRSRPRRRPLPRGAPRRGPPGGGRGR